MLIVNANCILANVKVEFLVLTENPALNHGDLDQKYSNLRKKEKRGNAKDLENRIVYGLSKHKVDIIF